MVKKKKNILKTKTYVVTVLAEYDFQPGPRARYPVKIKAKSRAEAIRKANNKYGTHLVIASSVKEYKKPRFEEVLGHMRRVKRHEYRGKLKLPTTYTVQRYIEPYRRRVKKR